MINGSIKIAIIGGGLFGCNTAIQLSKNNKIHSIDIYEIKNSLLSVASSNNQHRFHTGYHYPRSKETIKQIRDSSESFLKKYSDCLFDIKNNYYFISSESRINFNDYKQTFVSESKELNNLEQFNQYLYIDKLSGGLISNEKGINLTKLKNNIFNNLSNIKINIFTNTKWKFDYQKKYDFIINCSYYNPCLTTNNLNVKYEICRLLLINNPYNLSDYSITIMDGPYSSLYATENNNVYTLSNVEKTPFYKTSKLEELIKQYNQLDKYNFDQVDDSILSKTKEYFKLDNIKIVGGYITPKVKILNDFNDIRTTEILFEQKYITVLQGKISTIQYAAEQIEKYIERL